MRRGSIATREATTSIVPSSVSPISAIRPLSDATHHGRAIKDRLPTFAAG
jgi:hypothetical protein